MTAAATAEPRRALRIRETATTLGLSPTAIKRLVAAGELPVLRVGRAVLIPVAKLDEWIERRSTSGAVAEEDSGG